jgi:hypothetical protein
MHKAMEEAKSDPSQIVELTLPNYVDSRKYMIRWDKSDGEKITISPQTTFALLPTHYYAFLCKFLNLKNNQISDMARHLFVDYSSQLGVGCLCETLDLLFESPNFQMVSVYHLAFTSN